MKFVTDYLELNCEKNAKTIAVIEEDEKITYQDLLKTSKVIATNLISQISINEPIMVYMDKGIKTLETFFGILFAGGCYSLVNLEFPKSRINQIINVLESKIVITNEENYQQCKEIFEDCKILLVDDLLVGKIDNERLDAIKEQKIDLDPVYINFTSGSTGVPKGVVVGHRSIIDFINVFTNEFNINEKDIIANQAPFDFDVSVKDIYSAIFVGATLVIVPKKYFSMPTNLLDYIVANNITTMIWAVSALCLITTFHGLEYKVPKTVNKIIFSGEVMPLKHLKMWMDKLPDATFINVYGPTEITCNCTYHIIDRQKTYDEYIPIGKPFKNERVFLLNVETNELISPRGGGTTTGEICVSGSCLALGYYNFPSQTATSFIQNPLNNKYHELIYRTGDLGKYDEDGNLVFLGRKDFQIKYMGHRIELEEIDREISKIKNIKRTVTIFYEKKSRLYNFYIGDVTKEDIINELKLKVPPYMIPTNFVKLEEFKLNKNGKIDRKYLLEMIEGGKNARTYSKV